MIADSPGSGAVMAAPQNNGAANGGFGRQPSAGDARRAPSAAAALAATAQQFADPRIEASLAQLHRLLTTPATAQHALQQQHGERPGSPRGGGAAAPLQHASAALLQHQHQHSATAQETLRANLEQALALQRQLDAMTQLQQPSVAAAAAQPPPKAAAPPTAAPLRPPMRAADVAAEQRQAMRPAPPRPAPVPRGPPARRSAISFEKVSDVGLQRYLESFALSHAGLDRAALLATVQSHFDAWPFRPPAAPLAAPPTPDAAADPAATPNEAELLDRFFRKLFSGRGARRTRRGRRKRTCTMRDADASEADEKLPTADWDALPTEDYGKGRRQRRAKVRADL